MPHRDAVISATGDMGPIAPAFALRRALAKGYNRRDFAADILAGLVVGVVALPLSMALAIASGVPPQHGLYTAIVGGAIIAALGGSKVQVSGPTAAFVVILAPISAAHGLAGLMLASILAGIILIVMGIARMGRMIEFIPYPVTSGFTAGIALVIATIQLKDFLGLTVDKVPEQYIERIAVLAGSLPTIRWPDVTVGFMTLAILKLWPRINKRIPSPIVALPTMALLAFIVGQYWPQLSVATINTRFHGGIPQLPPLPRWPWTWPDPTGATLQFSYGTIKELIMAAFAIAMLGAIESLLSAVVADGMTGKRHNPDAELLAQGVGNVVAPFFGGFAATGAIARTATNIRSGARSPLAAIIHSMFLLLVVVLLAPLLGYLPMAALAALLLLVAWNMAELKHCLYMLRVSPRNDVLVLLACFTLTVLFDMVVAVGVGVVLAALLFMGRMARLAGVQVLTEDHPDLKEPLPPGILLYRFAGPLFFGAAQKALSQLHTVDERVRVVLLDLTEVPTMDATGLVNLESALQRLHAQDIFVVIAGARDDCLRLMAAAGWKHRDWLVIWRSFEDALALARTLAGSDLGTTPVRSG